MDMYVVSRLSVLPFLAAIGVAGAHRIKLEREVEIQTRAHRTRFLIAMWVIALGMAIYYSRKMLAGEIDNTYSFMTDASILLLLATVLLMTFPGMACIGATIRGGNLSQKLFLVDRALIGFYIPAMLLFSDDLRLWLSAVVIGGIVSFNALKLVLWRQ